jgi:hypothetical protein
VPLSSFLGNVQRFAGQKIGEAQRAYQQLDKSTGGWLPGGGVASPITKAVFPPQSYPGRSEELERITGVSARFVDPSQTTTVVRRIAPAISPKWGTNDYANPLLNEVGISNYQGGITPRERQVEFHELGHINPADKQWFSSLGVSGRYAEGLNRSLNSAPLNVLSGFLMKNADAREEDRAERFAAKFAPRGGYEAPKIYEGGTSDYGNSLRRQGQELINKGVEQIANPWGLTERVGSFINQQRAKPALQEYERLTPMLKSALSKGDMPSAETIKLSKRHSELEQQLRNLGVSDDELMRRLSQ